MRKNLGQRKAELERQKIAIMGKEKALKETMRRERTKKLIEIGGLVAKAGIDTLDTHALYGALLSIKEKMNKTETLHHKKNQAKEQSVVVFRGRLNLITWDINYLLRTDWQSLDCVWGVIIAYKFNSK